MVVIGVSAININFLNNDVNRLFRFFSNVYIVPSVYVKLLEQKPKGLKDENNK